jgi:hypothetical protein
MPLNALFVPQGIRLAHLLDQEHGDIRLWKSDSGGVVGKSLVLQRCMPVIHARRLNPDGL